LTHLVTSALVVAGCWSILSGTSPGCPCSAALALTCGAGMPWCCEPGRGLRAWGYGDMSGQGVSV